MRGVGAAPRRPGVRVGVGWGACAGRHGAGRGPRPPRRPGGGCAAALSTRSSRRVQVGRLEDGAADPAAAAPPRPHLGAAPRAARRRPSPPGAAAPRVLSVQQPHHCGRPPRAPGTRCFRHGWLARRGAPPALRPHPATARLMLCRPRRLLGTRGAARRVGPTRRPPAARPEPRGRGRAWAARPPRRSGLVSSCRYFSCSQPVETSPER